MGQGRTCGAVCLQFHANNGRRRLGGSRSRVGVWVSSPFAGICRSGCGSLNSTADTAHTHGSSKTIRQQFHRETGGEQLCIKRATEDTHATERNAI